MHTPTMTGANPEVQDWRGPRRGYRDWTVEHGRPWNYFDADPVEGTCQVVPLDGWELFIHAVRGSKVRVHVTKPPERWWGRGTKHKLHRSVFDTVAIAHQALFEAGVLAVRVYEDQTVPVQLFTRVGRGYGERDRLSVLSWHVPPAADPLAPLHEACEITLQATAQRQDNSPVTAQAIRYQHQGYPELVANDLAEIGDALYEKCADCRWQLVTAADRERARQPLTVTSDEVAAVDGWDIADGHLIETSVQVDLTMGEHGWEVASTSVHGDSLTVVGWDERYDNEQCYAMEGDEEECDPDRHREVVRDVYKAFPMPSGAELVALLAEAVLDVGHARLDHLNGELLRMFSMALHTVDRDFGDLVLRVFRRQLAEPRAVSGFALTPDGSRVIWLSAEAHAVLSGLIAPEDEVNRQGVVLSDAVLAEFAEKFPRWVFWEWANDPDAADVDDNNRYRPYAGT